MKRKMKKLILLIILIIPTIYIIYIFNNNHNINYTSLGDGYAQGINSYGIINYSYSDYLKDYLLDINKLGNYNNEFSYKNATINSLYNDIITNKHINNNNLKQLLRNTDILTLSIGLNDLLFKLSIEDNIKKDIYKEIKYEYDLLIKEINKYYHKDIYVIGYYATPKVNHNYINELNKILKSNKKIIYINTAFINKNSNKYLLNSNNIYPNHQGYKEISNKLISKISKKLEK